MEIYALLCTNPDTGHRCAFGPVSQEAASKLVISIESVAKRDGVTVSVDIITLRPMMSRSLSIFTQQCIDKLSTAAPAPAAATASVTPPAGAGT